MSVKRIYYVKHARQTYARDASATPTIIEVKKKDGTPKMGRGGRPMTRRVIAKDKGTPLPLKKCSKCGDTIGVGDPYLYWEPYFRSSTTVVRCMKATCFPRPSERESSLMQGVLAAQESVEDSLADLSDVDETSFFEDLQQEMVDALDEVIEQYQEADENFGGQGSSEAGQRAEELESQKDEVESVSFDDPPERDELDACDNEEHETNTEGCDDCDTIVDEAMTNWRDEQASNLQEALIF